MTEYGLAHAYPWKGMKGISREGRQVTLFSLSRHCRTRRYSLWWKCDDDKHSIRTNDQGSYFRVPTAWCWEDVIWWELPTFEQVLSTPKEKV